MQLDPLAAANISWRLGSHDGKQIIVKRDGVPEAAKHIFRAQVRQVLGFRQFPEARHQARIGRALPHEKAIAIFNPVKRAMFLNAFLRTRFDGQFILTPARAAQAKIAYGAYEALRILGQAHRCAEFHERLIVFTGMMAIKQSFG